ncbi:uncharacterized protein LOC118415426 [Branchiostoma floridae]|uniref:Uncharacterized protein LOC118415426 n=1 Tax=Branchiostoma floridae TaxID=7739 RepID=A0A9J7L645_BRAFL|nr:uncharacterized protein LOC118415426 [Branchiostoma floridae]
MWPGGRKRRPPNDGGHQDAKRTRREVLRELDLENIDWDVDVQEGETVEQSEDEVRWSQDKSEGPWLTPVQAGASRDSAPPPEEQRSQTHSRPSTAPAAVAAAPQHPDPPALSRRPADNASRHPDPTHPSGQPAAATPLTGRLGQFCSHLPHTYKASHQCFSSHDFPQPGPPGLSYSGLG